MVKDFRIFFWDHGCRVWQGLVAFACSSCYLIGLNLFLIFDILLLQPSSQMVIEEYPLFPYFYIIWESAENEQT